MATVVIDPDSLAEVTRLVEDFGRWCAPAVPLLFVHWQGRAMENERTLGGEAVWQEVSPAGWTVDLGGWVDTPDRNIFASTLLASGLHVIVDNKAQAASGSFVIRAAGNALSVVNAAG